jgi:Prophage endopeptidase tail
MARRLGRGVRQPVIFDAALNPAFAQFTQAKECDTARPITWIKQKALGLVTQTNTALTITVIKVGTAALPIVEETSSALAITKKKTRTVGIVTNTNTAIALTKRKSRTPITVSELDSAFTLTRGGVAPPTPPGDPLLWKVSIYNLNGSVVLDRAPCQAWMFNYVLNAPGAFEADLQLNHASVTESIFGVGAKEIRVYRGTVLTWGGYLWSLQASATNYKARIRGEGYFSRFRRRIIADDIIKKDKDSGDIAWDLIQYTQSTHGTFGITDGHIKTNVTIDHAYCATDLGEVGSAIEELSEMDDSFDFWITPTITNPNNKVFHTATPRRGGTKAVTINQDNAISAEYEIDATDLSNRIWGVGAGDCNPPDFETSAAASITTYGELHSTITYDDLDNLPSVKAHTREDLRLNKQPRRQVTVTLEERDYTWGSFDVGDIITLSSNRGYLTDSRQMRVIRIQTNFNPENRIAFHEIDLDSVIA